MQNNVFLQDKTLATRYGVHRSTIWRWAQERSFPQPVKLSPCCSRWRVADVERWEQQLQQQQETSA